MRLTVNPEDKGYNPAEILAPGVVPVILLNGKEVNRCITADDVLGMVEYYNMESNSDTPLDDLIVTEYGKVEIEFEYG